jgi:hypothetical protein
MIYFGDVGRHLLDFLLFLRTVRETGQGVFGMELVE